MGDLVFLQPRPIIGRVVPLATTCAIQGLPMPSPAALTREVHRRTRKAIPADALSDLPALSQLASRLEPALRKVFLAAVLASRNTINLEQLAAAISAGKPLDRLLALAGLEAFERRLAGYEGPLRRGFMMGSEFANTALTDAGLTINFNLMNTHAAVFSQQHTIQLTGDFVQGAKERIQAIITDAVTFGETAATAARRIEAYVGFTERDAKQYAKIEQELRAQGFSGRALEAKMERVRKAMIVRRAKVIARTEIIRAANAGQMSLWDEAATEGLIDKRTTRKRWSATDDELLEKFCRSLDGQVVGLKEEFTVEGSLGGVQHPPWHVACRCAMSLVFG